MPDAIAQILEKHINREQGKLDLDFSDSGTANNETNIKESLEPQFADGFTKGDKPKSMADYGDAPACTECGAMLELTEGCLKCPACGWSKCA